MSSDASNKIKELLRIKYGFKSRKESILYSPEQKGFWTRGPWDSEPDLIVWLEDTTFGVTQCTIRRHKTGHLCGYVDVPKTNHNLDFHLDIMCHGGSFCLENIDSWTIGFDCAHMNDLVPQSADLFNPNKVYRDVSFVLNEIKSIIRQLETLFPQKNNIRI